MGVNQLINLFEVYQDEKTGLYGVRDKQTHRIMLKPEYSNFKVKSVENDRIDIFYQTPNKSGVASFDFVSAIKTFENSIKNERYTIFKEIISGRYGIFDNHKERIAMLPIAQRAYIENGEFKFDLDSNTSVEIKEKILEKRNSYNLLSISYQLAFGLKKNEETIIEVLNSYTEPNYKMIDSKTGYEISKNKKIVSVRKVDKEKIEYSYIKLDKSDR